MLEQYNLWFNFIREKGCYIELHDMIFVTDCHADWAIGVYSESYTERNFGNALLGSTYSLLSTNKRTDVSIPLCYGPDHGRVMRSLQNQEETIAEAKRTNVSFSWAIIWRTELSLK